MGAVLLLLHGTDTFLEDITIKANRLSYFDKRPNPTMKPISKAYPWAKKRKPPLTHIADTIVDKNQRRN